MAGPLNAPASADDADNGLPPPGQRWGSGAHSVLPYLTKSLQAKPTGSLDPRDNRPDERPAAARRNLPQRPTA